MAPVSQAIAKLDSDLSWVRPRADQSTSYSIRKPQTHSLAPGAVFHWMPAVFPLSLCPFVSLSLK